MHGLGSYIRYFCKETVSFLNYFPVDELTIFLDEPLRLKEKAETTETEFRESMSHRLEGGYLLPGQTCLPLFGEGDAGDGNASAHSVYCWGWIRSSPA